jgi:hypothetical protein
MHGLYIYIGYNIILLVAYKLFNLKLYKPIEFISTYLHGMKSPWQPSVSWQPSQYHQHPEQESPHPPSSNTNPQKNPCLTCRSLDPGVSTDLPLVSHFFHPHLETANGFLKIQRQNHCFLPNIIHREQLVFPMKTIPSIPNLPRSYQKLNYYFYQKKKKKNRESKKWPF